MTEIRKHRERLGISQSELSRRSGVDVSALNRYETGCARPGPMRARKLAAALGVDVETIAPHLSASKPEAAR